MKNTVSVQFEVDGEVLEGKEMLVAPVVGDKIFVHYNHPNEAYRLQVLERTFDISSSETYLLIHLNCEKL